MKKFVVKNILTALCLILLISIPMSVLAAPAIPEDTAVYLSRILPSVVPAGTTIEQIPIACANHVAGILEYDTQLSDRIHVQDYDAYNEGWDYYYHPEKSFKTLKGLCSSYSGIHSMMVSSVPINPITELVDYSCKNPVYLRSAVVGNSRHVFTAVDIEGAWHFYDVCWFDVTGEGRFLDIQDESIMNDASHRNWMVKY